MTAAAAARLGLAAFVLFWILGPQWLRTNVPILLVFLVALGLELQFFLSARRAAPPPRPDAGPQPGDSDLGYGADADGLVLVRRDGEEYWLPYRGESEEELEELLAEAREEAGDDAADAGEEPEPPAPAPSPRAPLRRLLTGLALIAALAVAIWATQARTGWNGLDPETRAEAEELFSAEASRIAGKPVRIQCDERGEWTGVVQHADGAAIVGGDVGYLAPGRCHDLYRLAFHGEVNSSQTGRAISVLAHEAWHLRGERDEGVTECYAIQSGVRLGVRLGLGEARARQLMRQRLAENALHARGDARYLVPAECRAGGRLDLDPDDPAFP